MHPYHDDMTRFLIEERHETLRRRMEQARLVQLVRSRAPRPTTPLLRRVDALGRLVASGLPVRRAGMAG